MKFDTYAQKIVVYHQKIFGEDSPICTCARGVYVSLTHMYSHTTPVTSYWDLATVFFFDTQKHRYTDTHTFWLANLDPS